MRYILFFSACMFFFAATMQAQEAECSFCRPRTGTKTQQNFNASFINHRHIVALEKGNKMVIEMFNIKDYDVLKDMKEIFTSFRETIAPLKDSLVTPPSGSLRIDYAYNTAAAYRKIRIKKYNNEGDLFIANGTDISPLKVEQDTIRILVQKKKSYTYKGVEYKNYLPVQVTLVLNNYTDVDSLIKTSADIQHFVDTMSLAATPKHKIYPADYKTTINYHPYPGAPERFSGKYRFIFYEGIVTDENVNLAWITKFVFPQTFAFMADIGAGLTGGKIATMAQAGVEYRWPKMRGGNYVTMMRASVTPYFLFDKSATGKLAVYDNWFVNLELGSVFREEGNDYLLNKETVGVGYLIKPNGGYLTGTTMKAFMNFPMKQQINICPEFIFTNNFRTIFPAVTIKGFFNRD